MTHPLINQILHISIHFLSPNMTVDEMLADLGPVLKSDNQHQIIAQPGRWQAELVTLNYLKLDYDPKFLVSVDFEFSIPQTMRMADLIQAFGTPKHFSGMRPTAPDNYLFQLNSDELRGSVIVNAFPKDDERNIEVQRIGLNRIPPEMPPVDHARALKIVAFAPLAATIVREGTVPFWMISEHFSIDDLVAQLRPELNLKLPDRLGFGGKCLDFNFCPSSMDDFEPNRILWLFAETAELLNLRIALDEFNHSKLSLSELLEHIEEDALPKWAVQTLRRLKAEDIPYLDFITAIDRILSEQLIAILSDQSMRALRASWLGLAWLAENLDIPNGSHIQVYPVTGEKLLTTFQNDFLFEEIHHPQGIAPTLIIVDKFTDQSLSNLDITGQLMKEVNRIEIPVIIGMGSGTPSEAEELTRLAGQADSRNLLIAEPRILIRPGPEVSGFSPVLFDFKNQQPEPTDLSIWVNGAWLLGAAVATGHADSQMLGNLKPVSLPERLAPHMSVVLDLLKRYSQPSLTYLSSLFEYDDEAGGFVAKRVRTLNAATGKNISLARVMQSALVLGIFRRVQYRSPKQIPLEKIKLELQKAIQLCLPGSTIEVKGDANKNKTLVLQVSLPEGESVDYNLNWK